MTLPKKFVDDMLADAESFIEAYHDKLSPLCDSPIEELFATAFLFCNAMRNDPVAVISDKSETTKDGRRWFIEPQVTLLGARVDFLIGVYPKVDGQFVIVECDGHDFHERTPKQAARDRSRDRAFQAAGYKIFRFTGTEIHRKPSECARDVVKELLKMVGEW